MNDKYSLHSNIKWEEDLNIAYKDNNRRLQWKEVFKEENPFQDTYHSHVLSSSNLSNNVSPRMASSSSPSFPDSPSSLTPSTVTGT